jgi:hypothetical protein
MEARVVNLKGFGRKRTWPNRGTIAAFTWKERKTTKENVD